MFANVYCVETSSTTQHSCVANYNWFESGVYSDWLIMLKYVALNRPQTSKYQDASME